MLNKIHYQQYELQLHSKKCEFLAIYIVIIVLVWLVWCECFYQKNLIAKPKYKYNIYKSWSVAFNVTALLLSHISFTSSTYFQYFLYFLIIFLLINLPLYNYVFSNIYLLLLFFFSSLLYTLILQFLHPFIFLLFWLFFSSFFLL